MSEQTWTGREVMSVMVEHPDKIFETVEGDSQYIRWDKKRNQFRIAWELQDLKNGKGSPCMWLPWALDATWREWKPEPEEREPVVGAIYTGTKVKSLMAGHPGLKFEIVHSKDGERLVVWKEQYMGWGYTKLCNDGYRRCGGKIEWPDSWDNAVWRLVDDKKPEPEPDPRDRIYTGAEAFQLMAETPGRAFTPVDVTLNRFRVYSTGKVGRFQSEYEENGNSVRMDYAVYPHQFEIDWREYFPKPESKPTTGLSFDEAVERVRSGEAKEMYIETFSGRGYSYIGDISKEDLDATDWKVRK